MGTWRHILLEPLIYERCGTFRVKRCIIRSGGINPFPVAAMGTLDSTATWTPSDDRSGRVPQRPEAYYTIRDPDASARFSTRLLRTPPSDTLSHRFVFAFWSFRQRIDGSDRWEITNGDSPSLDNVQDATAYFVWDQGDGPGEHGVYLDAFDESAGEFLADEFVAVNPDSMDRQLTTAADNGLLMTSGIGEVSVVARAELPPLRFRTWRLLFSLGDHIPEIGGATLTVRDGHIAVAFAFYRVLPPPLPQHPPQQVLVIPTGFHIISGLAGGPLQAIGVGTFGERPPGPLPPDETYIPTINTLKLQLVDLERRLRVLEDKQG